LLNRFVTRHVVGHLKLSYSWSSVRLPIRIFHKDHRDRCLAVRHSGGRRWRGRGNSGIIRAVSSVRHSRPCVTTQTPTTLIRFQCHRASLVRIASLRLKTIGASRRQSVHFYHDLLWYSSSISPWTNTLYHVYTPDFIRIIERHGLLPYLFADHTMFTKCNGWTCSSSIGVHRWNSELDAVKQTPTQSRQDLINLVWYSQASSFTFGYSDQLAKVFVSWRCITAVRQIWRDRRTQPPPVIKTLVVPFELTRLDNGNATLASIPAYLLRRLLSVLNAAARIIATALGAHQHDSCQPSLVSFVCCLTVHQHIITI